TGESNLRNLAPLIALSPGDLKAAGVAAKAALASADEPHVGMPRSARAHWATVLLCAIELGSRQPAAARRILQALDPNGQDPQYAMNWCRLCALEGDWERAATHYRRAEARGQHALWADLEYATDLAAGDLVRLQRLAARPAD